MFDEVKNAKIYAEVVDGELVGSKISGTMGELLTVVAATLETMAKGEEFTGAELAGLVKELLEGYEKQEREEHDD